MNFSKDIKTIEKGGIVAIFNRCHPDPVFFSAEDYKRIKRADATKKEKDLLARHGIIGRKAEEISTEFSNLKIEDEVMTLYLILTRLCNLRCKYCFEMERKGKKEYKDEVMSKEIAKKSLELFAEESRKNKHKWNYQIVLYGGEPLLDWELFKYVVLFIEELKKNGKLDKEVSVIVNSNGLLINDEKIDFLKDKNLSLAISLDPNEKIHNKYRVNAAGKPTYELALKAIKRLKKEGIDVSVSVTVTPESLRNFEQDIKEMVEETGVKVVGFNPVMGLSSISNKSESEYMKELTQKMINLFLWFREKGIYEDRIMRKVKSFVDLNFYSADCCAYGQQIVVQPDGSVGICHATADYNYSNVNNYISPYKTEMAKIWRQRLPINNKHCENCEAIFVCGGGCAQNAKLEKGEVGEIDTAFCIHTKEIFDFLIWEMYK